MDEALVKELNQRNHYPVIIKGSDFEERLVIEHVRAIHATDKQAVIRAVVDAKLAAISVGKTALPFIGADLAKGLLEREKLTPGRILDIILAENMRSADLFFREKLKRRTSSHLPTGRAGGIGGNEYWQDGTYYDIP